jgi:SAM-dependent MidA family methyltransferase
LSRIVRQPAVGAKRFCHGLFLDKDAPGLAFAYNTAMEPPPFSPDDIALSAALQRKVGEVIAQSGGWMPFSRYMEIALYEPGLGYYSNGRTAPGLQGDFVTAPEISPFFGQTLAHALVPFMAQSAFRILEIGAGSGQLARDILTELATQDIRLESYGILDLSGGMREKQQEALAAFPQVRWLDSLPEAFTGVIVGNEVLDAMPVRLVIRKNGGWHERGVSGVDGHFVFEERLADSTLLAQIARQIPEPEALPEGYATEVHPHACAFIRSLAAMQQAGEGSTALFVDYGYPAREYYLPERTSGTLLSYARQRVDADVLSHTGLRDITAQVDFSVMANAAMEGGMALQWYGSQAAFLLVNGITERLLRISPEDTARYLPEARRMQMLLSPAEMGEMFKVLLFGNLELPTHLAATDRSERL